MTDFVLGRQFTAYLGENTSAAMLAMTAGEQAANYRETLAAGVADFAVGVIFHCDELGTYRRYLRIAGSPFYEDRGPVGAAGPAGADGAAGAAGADGADGADGVGVPVGGTTGQVLAKNSATNYDTEWVDPASTAPRPVMWWQCIGGDTAFTAFAGYGALFAGTATAKSLSFTTTYTCQRLIEALVTVAATTAVAGFYYSNGRWFLGDAAGQGGFDATFRFGPATGVATATTRCFVGMGTSTAAPTDVEPSSLTSLFGVGWDAADTNMQIIHNDGSGAATKVDLGSNFPVPTADRTKVYDLRLTATPNSSTVNYTVTDLDNPTQAASGSITTNLPAVDTALHQRAWMSAGGTSSVIGMALGFFKIEG